MESSPPPSTKQDPLNNLIALIKKQQENFRAYLLVLGHMTAAVEAGDVEKIDTYRLHEASCRETIVSTGTALRKLEEQVAPGPETQALLREEREKLARLHRSALDNNTLTQKRLTTTMSRVKEELAALSDRLRRIEGGKSPEADDPNFIDIYS